MRTENFETWALVELFGHNRIVGKVSEVAIGGSSFIRVDVPKPDGTPRYSRIFGAAAIYAINPIDSATAIRLAQSIDAVPVQPYEVPRLAAGPDSGASEPEDEEEDLDDNGDPL